MIQIDKPIENPSISDLEQVLEAANQYNEKHKGDITFAVLEVWYVSQRTPQIVPISWLHDKETLYWKSESITKIMVTTCISGLFI